MAGARPPEESGNDESMTHNSHPEIDRESEIFLQAIQEARSEHLTYEQMDAWVEDEMDQTAREFVVAHIGLCDFCAKQLAAYESYAPVMSAPTAVPAKLVPFGERLRAAFRAPQIAMVALALVVAVLAPIVIKNSRSWGQGSSATESLPVSVRQAADDILNADTPIRPQALADLPATVDPAIGYPASEVIEEQQPFLRWKSFANSYSIFVKDSVGNLIAQGEGIGSTEWKVPASLNRGAMFSWEVRATNSGEAHRASFKVLAAADEQTVMQLRSSPTKPLVMGAVYQQFGMLTAARQEFEKLPASESGKFLDHLESLRK